MFAIIDVDIGMLRTLIDIGGVELQMLSTADTHSPAAIQSLANCATAVVPETDSPQRPGQSMCE
ncbi:hypothetical protein HNQ83_17900 [Pseudomonas sp. C2B4]|nr:hypothetical protein [Pseudomonas sp. C2B4]NUU36925.1 hypothetical protein [Pseudomonas sp. C2B4]